MSASHLRIYHEPSGDSIGVADAPSRTHHDDVMVPLTEILPLLVDAVESDRTWLRDFDDDEVTISTDLYDVLLAYRHFRRPSA